MEVIIDPIIEEGITLDVEYQINGLTIWSHSFDVYIYEYVEPTITPIQFRFNDPDIIFTIQTPNLSALEGVETMTFEFYQVDLSALPICLNQHLTQNKL